MENLIASIIGILTTSLVLSFFIDLHWIEFNFFLLIFCITYLVILKLKESKNQK